MPYVGVFGSHLVFENNIVIFEIIDLEIDKKYFIFVFLG